MADFDSCSGRSVLCSLGVVLVRLLSGGISPPLVVHLVRDSPVNRRDFPRMTLGTRSDLLGMTGILLLS